MQTLPFEVRFNLSGWRLFWALLELEPEGAEFPPAIARSVSERVRKETQIEILSSHPTIAALRKLFKAAGCDPTRYRPSSEALLRRLLKGEEMPIIQPLVDLNNCLSACLAVPCCVMAEQNLSPPFVFRPGMPGESYESLRGPFNLEGKPVLADELGACDVPITGGQRVKVTPETRRAWLVAYLPAGIIEPQTAEEELLHLVELVPFVTVHLTAAA
jgi:DNA/RNA-binding domain of Phe-tRNA-synthetase-like protein